MYKVAMYKKINKVAIKSPAHAFFSEEKIAEEWEELNYTSAIDLEGAVNEFKQFKSIIHTTINQVDQLPYSKEVSLDSIYTHDILKMTPKGAILLNSGKEKRRSEIEEAEKYLKKENIPIIGRLSPKAYADGGDLIWFDEETLVIGRSYRTNALAIKEITKLVEPFISEVKVVDLPHDLGPENCLHLMSLVSLVDIDLAVTYSQLIPISFREWMIERGIRLLDVTEEEYNRLGSNVLAVAPRKCVMIEGNPIIQSMLEEEGCEVMTYRGYEISLKGTGGPTCLTCPIVRE